MRAIKKTAMNSILLLVSTLLTVAAMELGLRLVLTPSDLLNPDIIVDERYTHRIAPNSAGHDAWGFRNAAIPASANVLAVGDSMTYGVSARASESWPSWLARFSGLSVYNAGVGAYGPVEYVKVVLDYASRLRPSDIVVGIYLGNDLWDAWYKCQNFQDDFESVEQCVTPSNSKEVIANFRNRGFAGDTRDWLSKSSVLYQALKYNLDSLVERVRFAEARILAGQYHLLIVDDGSLNVAFDQSEIRLDPESAEVKNGLSVLWLALAELNRYCKINNVSCHYALLPTKQSVFYEVVKERMPPDFRANLQEIYLAEGRARETIISHLQSSGMHYFDLLPGLQAAVGEGNHEIYLRNFDTHPSGEGYRLIGRAICDHVLTGCGVRSGDADQADAARGRDR